MCFTLTTYHDYHPCSAKSPGSRIHSAKCPAGCSATARQADVPMPAVGAEESDCAAVGVAAAEESDSADVGVAAAVGAEKSHSAADSGAASAR